MTIANVSQEGAPGLPPALARAQAAILFPDVQEMLCTLAKYNLGIFMPHMHDDQTGDFQPLADNLMQVEAGLEVSFRPAEQITVQKDHFLPTGWCWRAGAPTPVAACEMAPQVGHYDAESNIKHRMLGAI